jgi:primosomal protein N' (replication factor Y)
LLSQPLINYPLDLIIFLNADIGLNIPDYNANERNFQLLYETFQKHTTPNFIVQSFNPHQYSIRNACKLDKQGFYDTEYAFRKTYNYPPYSDLCVILYKNEIEGKVFAKVDTLYKELLYLAQKYQMKELEIYSTPPLIYKMFGKYRYNIILKGKEVRNFMDVVYTKLHLNAKGFKINREADTII